MKKFPTYQTFGEHAILLDWPSNNDLGIHDEVLSYARFISESFSEEIIETVPTYQSLAVYLKPEINIQLFMDTLMGRKINISEFTSEDKQLITIPVCYEPEFGVDIQIVAESNHISVAEVIKLHTKPVYKIFFLGFLPGFPYLEGLNTKLNTPRRDKPRPLVERGSVGIGGAQTGIYTVDSPGGWNIIGRTPLQFFDTSQLPPTKVNAGDFIKFQAINQTEFDLIRIEVEAGTFQWRKEVHRD